MNWWIRAPRDDGRQESYGCTASFFDYKRQQASIEVPMLIDNADRKWAPQEAYLDEPVATGADRRDTLAMISPAGIFRAVAGALCGTDRAALERRLDDVRRYRETFISYLRGKDIWSKYEWVTPDAAGQDVHRPTSWSRSCSGGRFKTRAAYDKWAEKQTRFPGSGGKCCRSESWRARARTNSRTSWRATCRGMSRSGPASPASLEGGAAVSLGIAARSSACSCSPWPMWRSSGTT